MTRTFLFGVNASGSSQNKYLVEFRAGKMTMKDRTVSADKRKGLLFVHQTDDSLMHFCWKDRTSGNVEDDLIIFPDDVVFKRVPECTTGRVFVLKFKSSSRKNFYWLQEPKTDHDTEYCNKVNQYLNNPPSSSSRSGAGGSSTPSQSSLQAELNNLGEGDVQNLLNNISHEQLLQILGGVGGMGGMASLSSLLGSRPFSGSRSTTSDSPRTIVETPQPPPVTTAATATATTTATTQPTVASSASSSAATTSSSIQLSDLQNILSGLNVPATSSGSPAAAAADKSVDLSSALTAEVLQPLFNNKDFMERLSGLLPATTETSVTPPPSSDSVRSTVQSPQFQQALSQFSYALQSGQLGPLMQHFGMSTEIVNAANSGDMDAFVKAMQNAQKTTDAAKDKDADKDEDMSLD